LTINTPRYIDALWLDWHHLREGHFNALLDIESPQEQIEIAFMLAQLDSYL
jgi:hypothetical protein